MTDKSKEIPNTDNGLWTMEDVAEYLHLKPATIQDKVFKRSIPFIKLGGAVRFRKEDIDRWIEEQKVEPFDSAQGKPKQE